jgi:uncharacterized oxidoreductase
MNTTGNTVLFTGGGSGIGREIARRLHDLGNHVIVAGRRREALLETAAGHANIHVLTFDATSQQSIQELAKEAVAQFPAINVLVNNAGIMQLEDVTNSSHSASAEAIIATNLLGPILLTNLFLPHLLSQPNAAVINTTSGLAFVPLPKAPTYCATKAALHSYTISLREQLRGKVEVIEIAPPAVRTDLTPGQSTREGYMPLDEYIDQTMALLTAQPTPAEVLVEKVRFLRNAEAEGRFDAALAALKQL